MTCRTVPPPTPGYPPCKELHGPLSLDAGTAPISHIIACKGVSMTKLATLDDLLVHELQDLYDAEHQIL